MEIDKFTELFAAQFEETAPSTFTPHTIFREIDEWSSLIALSLIAMIDEEYNVSIRGEEILKSKTIEDLFLIVKSKV